MFGGCFGLGYGGFGGGIFIMIIPLLLIGIVIYSAFRLMNQPRYSEGREDNKALDILMERYALGEITEEEYLKKKSLLRR